MELTLKELAPYLPYNLPLSRLNKDNLPKLIHMNNGNIMLPIEKPDRCKPILKPLTDYLVCHGKNVSDLGGDMGDEYEIYEYATQFKSLASVSYSAYELMIRNHVDVFRLIDKGLAIDINIPQTITHGTTR